MQKKELFFNISSRAAENRMSYGRILAALISLIKTQAIAPLVLKANKVLLVHHHLVVDGEDLTAILALKPMVAVVVFFVFVAEVVPVKWLYHIVALVPDWKEQNKLHIFF